MKPEILAALEKLINQGGFSMVIDQRLANGEFYVQMVKAKKGFEKLACGYYPSIERGIFDCINQINELEKEPKFC